LPQPHKEKQNLC